MLISLLLFLILLAAVFYFRLPLQAGSAVVLIGTFLLTAISGFAWLLLLVALAVVALLNVDSQRRPYLIEPVFRQLRRVLPAMSETEERSVGGGNHLVGKGFVCRRPDWDVFDRVALPQLSAAEQSFLDVEVEALCKLIDDWDVQQRQDLSPQTWQYLREHGFFGLIIPQEFGGKA